MQFPNLIRRKRVWIPLAAVGTLLAHIGMVNRHSLHEGMKYLVDRMTYEPTSEHQVSRDGRFGLTHELVSLSSAGRMEVIKRWLAVRGVEYEVMPVAYGYENIFVPGNLSESFIVVAAHYDKATEDPAYQGATDNTASVAVLLAVIEEIEEDLPDLNVAFLFTALEESGLRGATHFIDLSEARGYRLEGVLSVDGVGRGKPVIGTPSSAVGFRFNIPVLGWKLYDGADFSDAPHVRPINQALRSRYLPGVPAYRAFLSITDANAFLNRGIPALHIWGGNMWHAEQTWHSNGDTVDRLDENDMALVWDIVLRAVERSSR